MGFHTVELCKHVTAMFVFSEQKKLTTLDIAANRVKKIENISHLTELQEFWVQIVCLTCYLMYSLSTDSPFFTADSLTEEEKFLRTLTKFNVGMH